MSQRFERHARDVTILTFVSRISGMLRDAALSRAFGVGSVMDAFSFAFMIPNLFRRLFGEGALSASFIPVYTRLERDSPEAARSIASLLIGALIVTLGAITLIGEAILWLLLQAAGGEHLGLRLTMILLPYMPLVCVVAIMGAVLQVRGRFGPTAASPVILNLAIIVTAIIAMRWHDGGSGDIAGVTFVAFSVIVAGALQVAWSAWALRGSGIHPLRWSRSAAGPLREIVSKALPMILGLGVLQLNTFVDGLIASYPTTIGPTIMGIDYPLSIGAQASLGYAQRLYEFPLGVFGIAVATAIFPALARSAADLPTFVATLRRGIRLVIFIGLPASVGLMLVSELLTGVLLQGGDFTADDTRRVAASLIGYAPAIACYSLNHTLTRAFYARGDTTTTVKVSIAMVVLNLAGNLTLMWTPLREAGLAWSTAGCATIQSLIVLRLLARQTGPIVDAEVRRSWIRSAIVTAAMAISVGLLSWLLPDASASWPAMALELAALVATGAIASVVTARVLGMDELRWAVGRS